MGVQNRRAVSVAVGCETSAVQQATDSHAEQRSISLANRHGVRLATAILVALGLVITLLIAAVTAILALAAKVVRYITQPPYRDAPAQDFTPWELGVPFEQVRIATANGELDAWYITCESTKDAPVIIVLAGHGGTKGDRLGVASYLFHKGFSCLLFDYRGVGASPGDGLSLGYRESMDALSALEWVSTRAPDSPIGLLGYSMGGSVAVRLAANDSRVRAVAIDSAFATQRKIVTHHVRRTLRTRPEPVVGAANLMLRRNHGFGLDDFEPLAEVGRIAPRSLLLIHPTDDRVVPLTHGLELWRAAGEPKEFWLARGAGHCGGYFQDREVYCARVARFFRDALCGENAGTR
jgi:uncharacterized protein